MEIKPEPAKHAVDLFSVAVLAFIGLLALVVIASSGCTWCNRMRFNAGYHRMEKQLNAGRLDPYLTGIVVALQNRLVKTGNSVVGFKASDNGNGVAK